MATYSDLDTKLTIRKDGNLRVVEDEDCIAQSINTILSTISGERVRNPIGSSIVQYLFQPMSRTTADQIRRTVFESINRYEPRVQLVRVDIMANLDQNRYDIVIDMRISELDDRRMKIQRSLRTFR
jgi:phage baseplate assembly protein W